jgi:hypothetical protein
MAYLLILSFMLLCVIVTFVLTMFTYKKMYYYIVDTAIIVLFFILGIIDSWGLSSWSEVTNYYPPYIIIRGILSVIVFAIKKYTHSTIKLSSCGPIHLVLMKINFILNFIIIFPVFIQWMGAAGI